MLKEVLLLRPLKKEHSTIMRYIKGLPLAVQSEVQENLDKRLEDGSEVRVSKVRHARNFLQLKKKYNFRKMRLGMN